MSHDPSPASPSFTRSRTSDDTPQIPTARAAHEHARGTLSRKPPRCTHRGVAELTERIAADYPMGKLCVIISCGGVIDALGYGLDILQGIQARGHTGHYFSHRSGETYKRWAEYCHPELFGWLAGAKAVGQTVLFIAVGGGCNGNATGLMAAMTNSHFVEVPTTPLHYNDATTSAKKARLVGFLDGEGCGPSL